MEDGQELYAINIEVRDKDHKLIKNAAGDKFTRLRVDLVVNSKDHLEHAMKEMANDLNILMPENIINVEAAVFNSISRTYMTMYSYYGEEKRFVKHS